MLADRVLRACLAAAVLLMTGAASATGASAEEPDPAADSGHEEADLHCELLTATYGKFGRKGIEPADGGPPYMERFVERAKRHCEDGFGLMCFQVAEAAESGTGTDRSIEDAIHYFQEACFLGYERYKQEGLKSHNPCLRAEELSASRN